MQVADDRINAVHHRDGNMRGVLRHPDRPGMHLGQCRRQRDRLVTRTEHGQGFQRRQPIPRHSWVAISALFEHERGNYQLKPPRRIAPQLPCHNLISQDRDTT